jgi:prolyl-tRNA editing enzyme YbaK/EbsC (Cys-tRNA(Pro) deacylase)
MVVSFGRRASSVGRVSIKSHFRESGTQKGEDALSETEEIEERVRAALEALGQPYEKMVCDPDFADTAAFCERYGIPPERSANTIIVASKKEPKSYCACLVLATTRLDVNHTVARLMGMKRLSFATAEETRALTGMLMGGVTVFALPENLPLYIDSAVMEPDWIIVGGGSRSSKIRIAPSALERLPNASVVGGLGQSRAT